MTPRWLGLGLSSNAQSTDWPQPYRVRAAAPDSFDYLEYSAPISLEAARREATLLPTMEAHRDEVPLLFHPVFLNLGGPALATKDELEALSDHLRAVGSPWLSNDIGWWQSSGQPFPGFLYLPPPLEPAFLEETQAHVEQVRDAIDVPLLLENPYVMAVRGAMHVLDFMAELHRRTGCGLLLDLGHLYAHQLARGLPLFDGLDRFPLDRVVEIHIAGGSVTERGARRFYLDDHSQPVRDELFSLLEHVLPACTSLRAVTFEGDGHPDAVALTTLRRLRRLVPKVREAAPLPQARPARSAATPRPDAWWQLFERAYVQAPSGDVEGERFERDYRLAVLAQAIDAVWPLTRLLVAGSPAELQAFAASPEFRATFADGRALESSFAAYARRRLRETADEAASGVLALETWAQSAARGPETVAAFPFDFSELLFAAKALRRHVLARGWTTGVVELESMLSSLRQVAARPARGPWKVRLVRRGSGVELAALEAPAT